MKTIQQIRLENFKKLIDEAGSIAKLARLLAYENPTYLYQVHSQKKNSKGAILQVGKRLATKLEQGMNKPAGWLDTEHHTAELSSSKQKFSENHNTIETITLALTGASGTPYGIRLLECLLAAGKTVYLVYSQAAQIVAQQEMNFHLPTSADEAQTQLCQYFGVSKQQLQVFGKQEWFAPIASGSAVADAMVICPASMGTVAAVAHGLAENLLHRAADVCIKEKRPLIIVPREAPLSTLHLENLLSLSKLGCTILPPAAGFYTHPKSINDMIDFVVARILDQLRIQQKLMPKWGT